MKNTFIFIVFFIITAGLVSLIFKINDIVVQNNKSNSVACTMEAKLCPDGVTYVERAGLKCEFQICPTPSSVATTSANVSVENSPVIQSEVTLSIGQTGQINDIHITLNQIIQDNRCPIDVRCIQAGSVTANIQAEDSTHSQIMNISTAGVAQIFDGRKLSILSVTPERTSQTNIPDTAYRITFNIEK